MKASFRRQWTTNSWLSGSAPGMHIVVQSLVTLVMWLHLATEPIARFLIWWPEAMSLKSTLRRLPTNTLPPKTLIIWLLLGRLRWRPLHGHHHNMRYPKEKIYLRPSGLHCPLYIGRMAIFFLSSLLIATVEFPWWRAQLCYNLAPGSHIYATISSSKIFVFSWHMPSIWKFWNVISHPSLWSLSTNYWTIFLCWSLT